MSRRSVAAPAPLRNSPDTVAARAFWEGTEQSHGARALKIGRSRTAITTQARKEQIALRVDADVLAWYRSLGTGWQTRMNAVLRSYRGTTL
jgi:uncharacterized protein (DUF4415 family)